MFGLISIRSALRALTSTPRRSALLVPLALLGSYMLGFGATVAIFGSDNASPHAPASESISLIPLQAQLVGLFPAIHAAGGPYGPKSCGGCDKNPLNSANYGADPSSSFYTNATGTDFKFSVPGDTKVGYININSPQKSVSKEFY